MDCKECKKLLSRFLDNELEQNQQEIMTSHIKDCPACAQSFESLTEMVNIMHNIKEINPPANFMNNVNKRLDELPFWTKVRLGIRNVFFIGPPARVFALMMSLVLVFAVTSQLNKYPKVGNRLGSLDSEDTILLEQAALKSGENLKRQEQRLAPRKILEKSMVRAKVKRASLRKKALLSEPASSALNYAESDYYSDQISGVESQDKGMNIPREQESGYIQANREQVLILSLPEIEEADSDMIKEILDAWEVTELKIIKQKDAQVFSFKIPYVNFLRLHSDLAGIGQLEKTTSNVLLYENKSNSISWQNKAFKELISVRLELFQE